MRFTHPSHGLGSICLALSMSLSPWATLLGEDKDSSASKPTEKEGEKLFDGKTLDGWESTKFGGEGDVSVEDGQIILEIGNDLTGVNYRKPTPKSNYEVTLEAMRVDGHDFFCGLTFPVGDSPCSLIVGGWGGGLVGLSSIDGKDASENETTTYRDFSKNQWYKIRLRVTDTHIKAWIDDKPAVDLPLAGHDISIRPEVDPSRPFGIASWRTKAALRNIRLRKL